MFKLFIVLSLVTLGSCWTTFPIQSCSEVPESEDAIICSTTNATCDNEYCYYYPGTGEIYSDVFTFILKKDYPDTGDENEPKLQFFLTITTYNNTGPDSVQTHEASFKGFYSQEPYVLSMSLSSDDVGGYKGVELQLRAVDEFCFIYEYKNGAEVVEDTYSRMSIKEFNPQIKIKPLL